MKHLGDITKINGAEIEPVWCIIGGSPCQDLSVAGKRAGIRHSELGDEETTRSGLFMEQMRIVKEMRERDRSNGRSGELVRPRYMVWENVPGAFSSSKGLDFQAVLEEVIKVVEPKAPIIPVPDKGWPNAGCVRDVDGRWSVSWRVHDAQFWGKTVTDPCGRVVEMGTPQRRRRISLVADFGGDTAFQIQFESEGLSGDTEESGETRESTSSDSEASTGNSSCTYAIEGNGARPSHLGDGYHESDLSYTLNTTEVHGVAYGIDQQGGKGMAGYGINVMPTIASDSHGTPRGVAYGFDAYNQASTGDVAMPMTSARTDPQHCPCVYGVDSYNQTIDDVAQPLRAADGGDTTPKVMAEEEAYTLKIRGGVEVDSAGKKAGKGALIQNNLSGTLGVSQDQTLFQPIAYGIGSYESNAWKSGNPHSGVYEADVARTLDAINCGYPGCNQGGTAVCEEKNEPITYAGVGVTSPQNKQNPELGVCHTLNQDSRNYLIEAYGLTAKGNGDAFINPNTHTSLSVGGGEPGQGYPATLVRSDEVVGTLCARGYPDKLTHQDVVQGMYPVIEEPILLESNQNHATVQEDGVSTALPASMGMGGGYVPMVTEHYAASKGTFMMDWEKAVSPTLQASDYKEPVTVMAEDIPQMWDGTQVAPTLTSNNAGGNQRMPDKENFNCVLQAYDMTHASDVVRECGEVAPTLQNRMGTGGNQVPITIGFDGYNAAETGEVQASLGVNCGMSTGRNGVIEKIPMVDSIGGQHESYETVDVCHTLKQTHYKNPPAVAVEPGIASREGGHYYEDISGTLRSNAGDNQMSVAYEDPT